MSHTLPNASEPAPAFDVDELNAAIVHAAHLEMCIQMIDLDTADETIAVAPFHIKPGTPIQFWDCNIEWFIETDADAARRNLEDRVCVSENSDDSTVAFVKTPRDALDYIARTRLLRAAE